MEEAHFYSDIYFQSSETDVFLLLPGNQKYDCDFVQDAGFNGCGQNIPDCEGDADKDLYKKLLNQGIKKLI